MNDQTKTQPTNENAYRILKTGKCSTLSNKSDLKYEVGAYEDGAIHIRIIDNSGGGFFSKEWVALADIEKALSRSADSITAIALWPLFKGKSVNTPAFLLAVLKAEGVVVGVEGKKRAQQLGDLDAFKASVTELASSGTDLSADVSVKAKPAPKKPTPAKKPASKSTSTTRKQA